MMKKIALVFVLFATFANVGFCSLKSDEINIYNPDKKEKGFQKMYLDNELKEKNQVELKKEGRYKIDFII